LLQKAKDLLKNEGFKYNKLVWKLNGN
jgi:hypothetical protein